MRNLWTAAAAAGCGLSATEYHREHSLSRRRRRRLVELPLELPHLRLQLLVSDFHVRLVRPRLCGQARKETVTRTQQSGLCVRDLRIAMSEKVAMAEKMKSDAAAARDPWHSVATA